MQKCQWHDFTMFLSFLIDFNSFSGSNTGRYHIFLRVWNQALRVGYFRFHAVILKSVCIVRCSYSNCVSILKLNFQSFVWSCAVWMNECEVVTCGYELILNIIFVTNVGRGLTIILMVNEWKNTHFEIVQPLWFGRKCLVY